MTKKIVIIIPARYKSSRFEGKPLVSILNKPMIQHVYERACMAKYIENVIVATDDKRIFDTVSKFNGHVAMTSSHHQSGTNRIAEVALDLDCDWIINLQGDEPLIDPAALELMALSIMQNNNDYCFSLMKDSNKINEFLNPNNVKVIVNKNDYALYFSRAPIPYPNNICLPHNDIRKINLNGLPNFNIHLGVYAYKKDFLLKITKLSPSDLEQTEILEQLRILSNGYQIKMLRVKYISIGVDTKEDIELAEEIMKKEKCLGTFGKLAQELPKD